MGGVGGGRWWTPPKSSPPSRTYRVGWLVCVVVRFLFYYATTPKELDVLWVEPPQAECRFPCTVVSCSLGRLLGHWHNTCDLKCFGSWESADLPTYVAH